MVSLTKLEKLMFPSFLCVFQLVFIILYALLVRYDDTGKPHVDLEVSGTTADYIRTLESYQSALKVYPCEYPQFSRWGCVRVCLGVGRHPRLALF